MRSHVEQGKSLEWVDDEDNAPSDDDSNGVLTPTKGPKPTLKSGRITERELMITD
jgi:hypothetical protein